MSCHLEPSTLGFNRPLTTLVKRNLSVHNPNDRPIIFKVKTTAPKQYCVRPNSGRVEPGEKVEVQVLLQPMKEDPAMGTKCRDKFLVQSAFVPPDSSAFGSSFIEIWQSIERTSKSEIQEQKIRCSYLAPLNSGIPEEQETQSNLIDATFDGMTQSSVSNVGGGGDSAFVNADEDPKFSTIKTNSINSLKGNGNGNTSSFQPSSDFNPIPYQSSDFIPPSSPETPTISNSSLPPSEPQPLPPSKSQTNGTNGFTQTYSSEEVESIRSQYETQISKLRQQLDDSTNALRQRSIAAKVTEAADEKTRGRVGVLERETEKKVDGVPMQIVMALMVGMFVFTWLFF